MATPLFPDLAITARILRLLKGLPSETAIRVLRFVASRLGFDLVPSKDGE